MKSEVAKEVQAVLLNSSDDPKEEIQRALVAVAEFAFLECSMAPSEFERLAKKAYKTALETPL
jgi:hypothetical protein